MVYKGTVGDSKNLSVLLCRLGCETREFENINGASPSVFHTQAV